MTEKLKGYIAKVKKEYNGCVTLDAEVQMIARQHFDIAKKQDHSITLKGFTNELCKAFGI